MEGEGQAAGLAGGLTMARPMAWLILSVVMSCVGQGGGA